MHFYHNWNLKTKCWRVYDDDVWLRKKLFKIDLWRQFWFLNEIIPEIECLGSGSYVREDWVLLDLEFCNFFGGNFILVKIFLQIDFVLEGEVFNWIFVLPWVKIFWILSHFRKWRSNFQDSNATLATFKITPYSQPHNSYWKISNSTKFHKIIISFKKSRCENSLPAIM